MTKQQSGPKSRFRPKDGIATSHNNKEAKYWTSVDFAYQRYLDGQSESWRFDGIGFVLLQNQLTGFDLDHCRNPKTGEVKPWAQAIIQQAPTYWEASPSGTGLRGFASGQKPGSRCRNDDIGFEVYSSSRYLCISGHHLDGTPATIEAVQTGIDAIYHQMFPPTTHAHGALSTGTSFEYPDEVILDAARRAKNGPDFIALFDQGNRHRHLHSDGSPDYSRSDAALCRLLALFTKHEDQLDRLFRVSAFNRPKWESRADYRHNTIDFAIQSTPDQWSGPSAKRNRQPHDDASNEQHISSNSEDHQDHRNAPSGDRVTLPWSDYTNAVELIEAHGQNLRYCHPAKNWYVWDGKRWLADEPPQSCG